jgi:hypothetical protein
MLTWRVVGRTRRGLKFSRHGRHGRHQNGTEVHISLSPIYGIWPKASRKVQSRRLGVLSSHTFTAFARTLTSGTFFKTGNGSSPAQRVPRPSSPSSSRNIRTDHSTGANFPRVDTDWVQILQLNFTSTRTFSPSRCHLPELLLKEAAILPMQTEVFGPIISTSIRPLIAYDGWMGIWQLAACISPTHLDCSLHVRSSGFVGKRYTDDTTLFRAVGQHLIRYRIRVSGTPFLPPQGWAD